MYSTPKVAQLAAKIDADVALFMAVDAVVRLARVSKTQFPSQAAARQLKTLVPGTWSMETLAFYVMDRHMEIAKEAYQ
jgi:predicted peroxiredoxin